MDSQDQVLRRKTMRLVKVLWQHQGVEEAAWEREDTMRSHFFLNSLAFRRSKLVEPRRKVWRFNKGLRF